MPIIFSLVPSFECGCEKHVEQPELIAEVVKELVKTERNYILRKDETTVDLERTKLEKEDNKHLLDSLLQTIKDLKSK